ncbi:MAG: hypothetical protein R3F34_07835 [Planctomycetota bacterium]
MRRNVARTVTAPLAPVAALFAHVAAAPQEEPPNARETEALVEEFVGLRESVPKERAPRRDPRSASRSFRPLDAKAEVKWRKEIAKLWEKGPELEKKSGRHFLWEDDERGLYIVGGRTRNPKALLIGMHGGGAGSGDAGSAASAYDSACSKLGWVGVFPEVLEKTEHGWTDSGTEEFVIELAERARRTFGVDADHVFFSGHSMGGYGTWTLGGHHSDLVAALAPSAGAPTPIMDRDGTFVDVIEGVVPNLRNVPMVIYQSGGDPNVPPEANDVAVKKLGEARERWGGYDFEYWRVEGRGHDLPPGGMEALLEKVASRSRATHPDTIVWQPTLDWKRQMHWLFWEHPVPNAIVEARLDREANTVRITADADTTGLWVLLDAGVLDLERDVVVEVGGKETFRGRAQPELAALVLTASTGDPGRTFVARVPVHP